MFSMLSLTPSLPSVAAIAADTDRASGCNLNRNYNNCDNISNNYNNINNISNDYCCHHNNIYNNNQNYNYINKNGQCSKSESAVLLDYTHYPYLY